MKEQFVTYEIALKLKELGFDEECLTKWGCTSLKLYDNYKPCTNKDDIVLSGDFVSAPLWQQAFEWFRKEHGLYGDVYRNGTSFRYVIEEMTIGNSLTSCDNPMEFEEVRLECLKELINITKNIKNNSRFGRVRRTSRNL